MFDKPQMRQRWKPNLPEVHIAVVGANGSGKSALTVKYITKKYIFEYDSSLEDTYCKNDEVEGREYMVWIMDTVEGTNKDPNRYLGWADIFMVLYNITNRATFEYAEKLLQTVVNHEHSLCDREHTTCLVGNKTDMERYRQVSKHDGSELAAEYKAEFFETNCTEEYSLVDSIFQKMIGRAVENRHQRSSQTSSSSNDKSLISSLVKQHSSSDSDKSHHSPNPFARRSRTKSPSGKSDVSTKEKSATLPGKKSNTPLKWFKLFN